MSYSIDNITTHYLEEADALAGRVVVIDHGRVIADATPAAIKARVAGKRVSFDLSESVDEGLFAGLPVQNLEVSAHHVTLLSAEPEAVLQALFAQGARMYNLREGLALAAGPAAIQRVTGTPEPARDRHQPEVIVTALAAPVASMS